MNSWGYHLILDCKGSAMSKEIVKDAKFIKEFTHRNLLPIPTKLNLKLFNFWK